MDNPFSSTIRSIVFIALWLCCSSSYLQLTSAVITTMKINCSSSERDALIALKQSFTDPSARLSSWVGENCCQWHGITCDFISGKVTKIDLRNSLGFSIHQSYYYYYYYYDIPWADYKHSCLGGEISPSLLHLKYLNYLDLSWNDFEGAQIPYFLGMLKNLRYLSLSSAVFSGEIPFHLGNLSKLYYLDLSNSNRYFYREIRELRVENLHWLSGLSSLEYLDIGRVNLSSVGVEWMHTINGLSSLEELHLHGCGISSFDGSIPFVNLTSQLSVLDLSRNWINSSLPLWLSNLTSLTHLDMGFNYFQGAIPPDFMKLKNLQYLDLSYNELGLGGHIPSFLRNLCKLRYLYLASNGFGKLDEFLGSSSNCPHNSLESLDLQYNELVGEIPNSLGTFESLQYLDLSRNKLWGSLPNSISNLSLLQYLDVSYNLLNGTIPLSFGGLSELIYFYSIENSWKGVITEAQLVNLTKLKRLEIEILYKNQSLVFNVSNDWIPPFRLQSLTLVNCFLGPTFPVWLQVQNQLTFVQINYAGINDTIPEEWFSNISLITHLDLSNNLLRGKLPRQFSSLKVNLIDLNHNLFEDSLPLWSIDVTCLNLQQNLFFGPIPSNIGDLMPKLEFLYLSDNHLNGTIPTSIQKMSHLQVLSLGNNQLSGQLPNYWSKLKSLHLVHMADNKLYGEIPSSMGFLKSLTVLLLSNNHLYGKIPKSLQNCSLMIIDLGGNRLSGNLPSWIGESLLLIRLQSNLFTGTIPRQWCNLPHIQILDLSHNNLSGKFPTCLDNLTALVYGNNNSGFNFNFLVSSAYHYFRLQEMVVTKGEELEFGSTLESVYSIDLSGNRLSGEIPNEITKLTHLGTLNLSSNDLVGSIPKTIGDMGQLETLDLSCNHFSGRIPSSLASLTFLAHLNLSFNNLTGRIPTGMQLQTLNDPSIYEGNPSLCGSPLQAKCPGDKNTSDSKSLPILRRSEERGKGNGSEMFGFNVSMAIGFPVGFNILFFTILIKESWRASYFRFIDDVNYYILYKIGFVAVWMRRR